MERRPIIIVNTDNYPTFCDNRCNNTNCKKTYGKYAFSYGRLQNLKIKRYGRVRGVHIQVETVA